MAGRPTNKYRSEVEHFWRRSPEQSARSIHAAIVKSHGADAISLRTVEKAVRDLRTKSSPPGSTFSAVHWSPWDGEDCLSAEEFEYFSDLDLVCVAIIGRNLYRHEMKRARLFRTSLNALNPISQLLLIAEYGDRKRQAHDAGIEPPFTEDLDMLIRFKPWIPGNKRMFDAGARFAPAFYFLRFDAFTGTSDMAERASVYAKWKLGIEEADERMSSDWRDYVVEGLGGDETLNTEVQDGQEQ